MVKVKEQALIEKLVAHAAVEALTEAVLHRLSWRNEMPQTIWLSCAQASLALEVNSVPLSHTIMPGFPWRSTSIVNSRATHQPEIEVSGIVAKHSRVTSSTMFRMRNRRPQTNCHGQNPETSGRWQPPRPGSAPPSLLRAAGPAACAPSGPLRDKAGRSG